MNRKQFDSRLSFTEGGEASVKRTVARLLDFAVALALLLAIASLPQLYAAEWPDIRQSDTLWPLAPLGGPQWPEVPADSIKVPQTAPATTSESPGSTKDDTASRIDTVP